MLPTFFVIGAGHSGTTSLHSYLGFHPEIHVPVGKEPDFMLRAEDGPFAFPRVSTREEYEALFESGASARGDCSTSYSRHPLYREVPERIHSLVPEARVIYLVRDPVQRLLAHYVYTTSSEVLREARPLREALGNLDDPLHNSYVVPSLYATQIERYLEVFPAERVLVVDSADLRDARPGTLKRIFGFLGVDEDFRTDGFSQEFNVGAGKRLYSRRYARLRDSRLGAAWRSLPEGWRVPISRRAVGALTAPARRPVLHPDLRAALEEVFRPEVERLRQLTGQDFPTWSLHERL